MTKQGNVQAVRGVSLNVRAGEKVAIVGESGCGKSTLALALLGLLDPPGRVVDGDVWLNGRSLIVGREREMEAIRGKEISLIFQDPVTALDPIKRIGDQIAEGILRHRPDVKRKGAKKLATELLREVEIPAADRRLDDYPHQYSGGMRQRVMIAIALANEPDVLIADEPTTALDVTTQAQILGLLDRLVTERRTAIILITHNLGIVAEFCDIVHVMYAGRFVERGSVHDIFRRPIHPYTEALLASIPRPDRLAEGPLPSLPGFPPNLVDLPGGCPFEPRCPLGHGRQVCRDITPIAIPMAGKEKIIEAECHFARERWEAQSQANP